MVVIRLARSGSKKKAFYHVVVADKSKPRDGRFIERLGYYDPAKPDTEARIDQERLEYWKGVGAQLSTRVNRVVRSLVTASSKSAA